MWIWIWKSNKEKIFLGIFFYFLKVVLKTASGLAALAPTLY